MTKSPYKYMYTLELSGLNESRYRWRNLGVQMRRSFLGSYQATLIDLKEFRGEGSGQSLALADLANELEQVAAEIRREAGQECHKVISSWWRGTACSSRASSEPRCHPGDKCDNFPACESCGPPRL